MIKEQRKSNIINFILLTFLMTGFTFFSGSIMSGSAIAKQLSIKDFIIAIIIGNIFLAIYGGLIAYYASKYNMSTHTLSKYVFGNYGFKITSSFLSITQIGWTGVAIAMFSVPVAKVFNLPLIWVTLISGIIFCSSAYFGLKVISIISLILVPIIAVISLLFTHQTLTADLITISNSSSENISIFFAISIVIASFISGATLTADFVRQEKNPKVAVISSVIGFLIGNTLMFIIGGLGYYYYGKSNFFELLVENSHMLIGFIVLAANIWTTNDNALYTSSLGLSEIFKVKRQIFVIINSIIAISLSYYLYNHFIGFLTFISGILPSIGSIILVHHFTKLKKIEKKLNYGALVAWVIAGVSVNFISISSKAINNFTIAGIIYLIICITPYLRENLIYANNKECKVR